MQINNVQKNKVWRIGFFAFNNSASNALNTLMGYYALYTQNVLLLGVIMASMIMPMRILDGFTDPIAGNFLDKLSTRFGRYRPYMLIGNTISIISVSCIFFFPASWEIKVLDKQIIIVFLYAVYVIGFTMQTTATRAGQSIITGEPKQRPWYTIFDGFASAIPILIATVFITTSIISNDMYDPKIWHITAGVLICLSIIFTWLAIIGISSRDKPEFYMSNKKEKIKFAEFIGLFKRNKPLRLLILAASSDKLAAQLKNLLMIYFFSNVILAKSLNATFIAVAGVLGFVSIIIGSRFAIKKGTTRAFLQVSKLEVLASFIPFLLVLIFIPVGTTSYVGITNFGLIMMLAIYGFYIGLTSISTNLIFPMLGDISDYELLKSNKFIPGTIASMFSFVDKLISSFAGVILTVIMLFSGFNEGSDAVVPQNTFVNPRFYYSILFGIFIIPCIGHIISVIAIKNYPLDEMTMDRIAKDVAILKAKINEQKEHISIDCTIDL